MLEDRGIARDHVVELLVGEAAIAGNHDFLIGNYRGRNRDEVNCIH